MLPDGERRVIADPPTAGAADRAVPAGPARAARTPPPRRHAARPCEHRSGRVAGARSGDKGGNANIGLWARDDAGVRVARRVPHRRAGARAARPEAAALPIDVHPLPNLRAVNVVVHGLLGDGVASSTRPDPQAKGLGEYLRSRVVDVPEELL